MRVIEIVPKRIVTYTKIDVDLAEDKELLETQTKQARHSIEEAFTEKHLTPISEIKVEHTPFHFSSYCDMENCPFKQDEFYDIETCVEDHPEFVKTIGPVHLISTSCRVIPQQYERYAHLWKEGKVKGTTFRISR